MRRTWWILVALLILVSLGAVSLATDAQGALRLWNAGYPRLVLALGAWLLAAIIGGLALGRMHQATRRVERRLRAMKGLEQLERIDPPSAQVAPLLEALNGVVDLAQEAATRAADEAKEMEIQLKVATAQREHARAIIYSISDAVLVTDSYDDLVVANDAAGRTFDFDLDQTKVPVDRLVHDEKMVGLIRETRQQNSRTGRRIVEHEINTPSGARTYKVTLSCVTDRAGQTSGVVTVLHDMTRERDLARMKNDFVSNVSHELRTPLASIKAYTEMLIDGEATDEKTTREFYEVIQNEANRLSRLIDNILNISRIESGLVKVNKRPQSLMVLIKEAMEVISPQAKQKQIALEEQPTPAFYQTLIDKDMVYESMLNLLSNAVKYTPERGRITVQTQVDESQKKVIVRVSDTGVGIPPKDLPYVFDKFYRSDANSRMAKGTGLGLSLVKHVVETVHHGRMFVESQVGKGSTFGFELDLCE